MKSTGKIIYEVRMKKGLSQEELAEMAKVNIRTIQRIENDLTEPRETTINLIFGVLEIDQNEFKQQVEERDFGGLVHKLINFIFTILFNITIGTLIIYLSASNSSNIYSRIVSFFLCILISYFIVSLTRSSTSPMRLIKFGAGFIAVIIFALFQIEIETALFNGTIPSSLMALAILFYGNSLQIKK